MYQRNRQRIKILVMGDEMVGKSSLICAIISDFKTQVEKTLKKVILPPDMCNYSKEVFTEIIDTSTNETDFSYQLTQVDLVLLLYDVSSEKSVERLGEDWLPLIQRLAPNIPIVLVGNKKDIIELGLNDNQFYQNALTILQRFAPYFSQVQIVKQCSAFYGREVGDVLKCAQRVVLYPLTPLCNLRTRQITPQFRKALTRIFRILDKDMDGKLSDKQLASLQERVFNTQLNAEDISMIRKIINDEIQQEHITLNGFIALHKKCILSIKIQIPWSILRYFNYNDNLNLEVVIDKFYLSQGQTVELSSSTQNYLRNLYSFAIKNSADKPMQFIFSCSINQQRPLQQFYNQKIALDQFLLAWNYLTFLDYQKCYKHLCYIGYQDYISQTFKKTKSKSSYSNLLKLKDRKVLSIAIIDNASSNNYLNDLNFKIFDQSRIIQHNFKLYSFQNKSKILIFFKVDKTKIKQFLQLLGSKIDLLIYFQDRLNFEVEIHKKIKQFSQKINPSILFHRKITSQQADQILNVNSIPKINLKMVPVQYQLRNYQSLFNYSMQTITNIQKGLQKKVIENLKSKEGTKTTLTLISLAIVAAGVAFFIFKRK